MKRLFIIILSLACIFACNDTFAKNKNNGKEKNNQRNSKLKTYQNRVKKYTEKIADYDQKLASLNEENCGVCGVEATRKKLEAAKSSAEIILKRYTEKVGKKSKSSKGAKGKGKAKKKSDK